MTLAQHNLIGRMARKENGTPAHIAVYLGIPEADVAAHLAAIRLSAERKLERDWRHNAKQFLRGGTNAAI